MSDPVLSVVIPAFNEERIIGKTLRRFSRYLRHLPYVCEIILVDDGSTDATVSIARSVAAESPVPMRIIGRPANRGKGFSVREGVLASNGQFILFSDADSSAPITEWRKLEPWLREGYDVAIGSRYAPGHRIRVPQPWFRVLAGRGFRWMIQCMTGLPFLDTQCGFKAFAAPAAHAMFERQRVDRFAFDVEVLCLAQRMRHRVKEVGVRWNAGRESKVRMLRDGPRMLWDVWQMRTRLGA